MRDDSFRDFVLDQLAGLADLTCRPMFGGHGLYAGPDFFAIVYRDRLYFKTNDATKVRYEVCGMPVFQPNSRQRLKRYYEVPLDVLEDAATLVHWARDAAACR